MLGVGLPMLGTQLPLVWKDPTCHRTPSLPQLPSPRAATTEAGAPDSPCSATREVTAVRNLCTETKDFAATKESPSAAMKTQSSPKKKKRIEEFPGGSVVRNSELPVQGAQV